MKLRIMNIESGSIWIAELNKTYKIDKGIVEISKEELLKIINKITKDKKFFVEEEKEIKTVKRGGKV